MAGIIFLALVAIPIIEIIIFIQAGEFFGLWPTIGAVIVTAIIGTMLLRQQSFSVLKSVQASAEAGRPPVAEVFHGFCIVIGGALLLTPGFLTDAIGFALLTPPFRHLLARVFAAHIARRVDIKVAGNINAAGSGSGAQRRPGDSARQGDIIEGDYEEVIEPRETGSPRPTNEGTNNPASPWNRPGR